MNDDLVGQRFAPLRRYSCWGLHYDRQLNLTMSFGPPSLRIREPFVSRSRMPTVRQAASRRVVVVQGKWWLWLFCCYWRLRQNDRTLATGSSSIRRIELGLKELDGQKLVSWSVNGKTGFTRLKFDLGCELVCRRFERDSTSDVWTLYGPHDIVSVTGQGAVHREQSSDGDNR